MWNKYLNRTVLGVAAPLAEPEDLLPFKAIRKTSFRVGLERSEHSKEKNFPGNWGAGYRTAGFIS